MCLDMHSIVSYLFLINEQKWKKQFNSIKKTSRLKNIQNMLLGEMQRSFNLFPTQTHNKITTLEYTTSIKIKKMIDRNFLIKLQNNWVYLNIKSCIKKTKIKTKALPSAYVFPTHYFEVYWSPEEKTREHERNSFLTNFQF